MKYPNWAAFVVGGSKPQSASSEQWATWLTGSSRPPLTKIAAVAESLGVTERDALDAAGYALSLEERNAERRSVHRAKWRERWEKDPGFRAKHLQSLAVTHKKRILIRGFKPQTVRNLALSKMPESLRHKHELRLKSNNRKRAHSRGAKWTAGSKRRPMLLAAEGIYTRTEWLARLDEFQHQCAYCASLVALDPDHVVAINCGGSNYITNIVPSCKRCNSSKQDKDMMVWASIKGRVPHPLAVVAYRAHAAVPA